MGQNREFEVGERQIPYYSPQRGGLRNRAPPQNYGQALPSHTLESVATPWDFKEYPDSQISSYRQASLLQSMMLGLDQHSSDHDSTRGEASTTNEKSGAQRNGRRHTHPTHSTSRGGKASEEDSVALDSSFFVTPALAANMRLPSLFAASLAFDSDCDGATALRGSAGAGQASFFASLMVENEDHPLIEGETSRRSSYALSNFDSCRTSTPFIRRGQNPGTFLLFASDRESTPACLEHLNNANERFRRAVATACSMKQPRASSHFPPAPLTDASKTEPQNREAAQPYLSSATRGSEAPKGRVGGREGDTEEEEYEQFQQSRFFYSVNSRRFFRDGLEGEASHAQPCPNVAQVRPVEQAGGVAPSTHHGNGSEGHRTPLLTNLAAPAAWAGSSHRENTPSALDPKNFRDRIVSRTAPGGMTSRSNSIGPTSSLPAISAPSSNNFNASSAAYSFSCDPYLSNLLIAPPSGTASNAFSRSIFALGSYDMGGSPQLSCVLDRRAATTAAAAVNGGPPHNASRNRSDSFSLFSTVPPSTAHRRHEEEEEEESVGHETPLAPAGGPSRNSTYYSTIASPYGTRKRGKRSSFSRPSGIEYYFLNSLQTPAHAGVAPPSTPPSSQQPQQPALVKATEAAAAQTPHAPLSEYVSSYLPGGYYWEFHIPVSDDNGSNVEEVRPLFFTPSAPPTAPAPVVQPQRRLGTGANHSRSKYRPKNKSSRWGNTALSGGASPTSKVKARQVPITTAGNALLSEGLTPLHASEYALWGTGKTTRRYTTCASPKKPKPCA